MLMLRDHLVGLIAESVTRRESGSFFCETHQTPFVDESRPRSIWMYPMPGGFGQVASVRHLYCPQCRPAPAKPNDGSAEPVFSIQLIDVNEHFIPTGLFKDFDGIPARVKPLTHRHPTGT